MHPRSNRWLGTAHSFVATAGGRWTYTPISGAAHRQGGSRHTYYGLDVSGYPYAALKTIQFQRGSDPMLVNRDMTYDSVGNPTEIDDSVYSENIDYTYDHLDRLLTAGSPMSENFEYDEIGNITKKNALSYIYDPGHKHAVASCNGTSYGYDANGAMTTRGSQTIRYDKLGRPVRVDSGGVTLCRFAYDGDGVRRKRLDSSGTIHYLGAYERNAGNGLSTAEVITKYYNFGANFGDTILIAPPRSPPSKSRDVTTCEPREPH